MNAVRAAATARLEVLEHQAKRFDADVGLYMRELSLAQQKLNEVMAEKKELEEWLANNV